jgi:hypothetical protein
MRLKRANLIVAAKADEGDSDASIFIRCTAFVDSRDAHLPAARRLSLVNNRKNEQFGLRRI